MIKNHHTLIKGESGAVIPFLAIALVAIIGMAVLSVDQGQVFLSHRQAENLADTVALASVRGLDGTAVGWTNSGAYTVEALKDTLITTIDNNDLEAAATPNGAMLPDDIEVIVERGFYGHLAGYSEEGVFTPFPTPLAMNQDTLHLPAYYLANAVRVTVAVKNVEAPFMSTLSSILGNNTTGSTESILGSAIALRHNTVEVPVAPIAIPACEFFADLNPYSRARYDINAFQTGDRFKENLNAQCGREIIGREPGALEHDYQTWPGGNLDGSGPFVDYQARIDGDLRSRSYPLEPLADFSATHDDNSCYHQRPDGTRVSGLQPNCKAFPMNAILGIPRTPSVSTNQFSTADNLAYFLRLAPTQEARRARIGAPFVPLNGPDYLDHPQLISALSDAISNSPLTIGDQFYRAGAGGNIVPNFNLPLRKNIRSGGSASYSDPFVELRTYWVGEDPTLALNALLNNLNPDPTGTTDTTGCGQGGDEPCNTPGTPTFRQMAILNGSTSDFYTPPSFTTADGSRQKFEYPHSSGLPRYTNPMCTDPSTTPDSLDAKTLVGYAMLVASPHGSYCDFGAQMDNTNPTARYNALVAAIESEPVIVGYAEVNLFDFRISSFSPAAQGDPSLWLNGTPDIPANPEQPIDINDWSLDVNYHLPEFADLIEQGVIAGQDFDFAIGCSICNSSSSINCDDSSYLGGVDCSAQDVETAVNNLDAFASGTGGSINLPSWIPECFEELGAAIEEAGERAAAHDEASCFEICGGVYVPEAEADLYTIPTTNTNYSSDPIPSGNGDDMVWAGFDTECIRKTGVNTSFDGNRHERRRSCQLVADGARPTGSIDCQRACAGFEAIQSCGWFNESDCWESTSFCRDGCNAQQGYTSTLSDEALALNSWEQWQARLDLNNIEPPPEPGDETEAILEVIDNADEYTGASQVCYPRLLNQHFDLLDPDSWEDPKPRKAGWGCGGVRLRLSCAPDGDSSDFTGIKSLQFGERFDRLRPAIVGK